MKFAFSLIQQNYVHEISFWDSVSSGHCFYYHDHTVQETHCVCHASKDPSWEIRGCRCNGLKVKWNTKHGNYTSALSWRSVELEWWFWRVCVCLRRLMLIEQWICSVSFCPWYLLNIHKYISSDLCLILMVWMNIYIYIFFFCMRMRKKWKK